MNDTITLLTRRADLAPASADRGARTVEVIWSTGAPVHRRDMAGPYVERLSENGGAKLGHGSGGIILLRAA